MKNKIVFLTLLCLLNFKINIQISAGVEDWYFGYGDLFSGWEDPHSGLTVFPVLNIPSGGRYEGMGTAFTAVSDDSGALEANPAGTALLSVNEIALSTHAWIADSRMESASATGRIGNLGLGIAGKVLYLPYTDFGDYGEKLNAGYYTENMVALNVAYNLFASKHFAGIALGLNAKGAFRTIPASIYSNGNMAAGMVDLGLLTRFDLLKFYNSDNCNFSIGAALKNLGMTAGYGSTSSVNEPLPLQFSAGISYALIQPLLLSADFNLPLTLQPGLYPSERWNMAFGADIAFTRFLSLQMGFHLKENPRISTGITLDLKRFSFVTNYNLDLSADLSPLDKFSIQGKIKLGVPAETVSNAHTASLLTPVAASSIESVESPAAAEVISSEEVSAPEEERDLICEELKMADIGDRIVVDDIFFDKENNILEESHARIRKLAEVLKERKDIAVSISAYAPFSGDPSRDFETYILRAMKIQSALCSYNISVSGIRVNASGQIETEKQKHVVFTVLSGEDDAEKRVRDLASVKSGETQVRRNPSYTQLEKAQSGDVLAFSGILFKTGCDTLEENSLENLAGIASVLTGKPGISISISAYAEYVQDINKEFDLYIRRTIEIKNRLIDMGVEETSIAVNPSGKIVTGDIASNARIFIKIIDNGGKERLE